MKISVISVILALLLVGLSLSVVVALYLKLRAAKKSKSKGVTRFDLAFEYSPIGMAIVSLERRILQVNKSLCNIVSLSEAELLEADLLSIANHDEFNKNLNLLRQGMLACYQIEKRYIRKDNSIIWILVTINIVRDENNEPLYYLSQVQNIDEKKKSEQDLAFKAYYDTLTGLVNRNQLEDSMDVAISSALRQQQRFAILFLDIDFFKKINDTYGHDVGDHLLRVVGDRLKKITRKTDIASRLGGDEFILVLNAVDDPETAASFADMIMASFHKPININEHELSITLSMGISFYPSDGTDHVNLIKSADLALYKAKECGRDNYQFCTPEMNVEIRDIILLKNALKEALQSNQLQLVYLPRLDVYSNKITAFEALLRWNDKVYGNVPPAKIISLAEEIGIIDQLSEWIIKTATMHAMNWSHSTIDLVNVAINISPKHFVLPNFVDSIHQILYRANYSSRNLELEISESILMQDPDYSLKILSKLKSDGIKIIIDNFGTGYSSLDYLNQFSIDYIKFDRRFTRNIINDYRQNSLLSIMANLAKNLKVKGIAEGVESKEQFDILSQIGCDEVQGYYISRPVSSDEIPELLERYHSQVTIV